jgi:predicted DsbA family dithiol-disulfide isomerase
VVQQLEVFADVACPFAHVGLARFAAVRAERGWTEPVLRVRAWPLELVNGKGFAGHSLTPKIEALRADVAQGMFAGFDEQRFPATSVPAMVSEAAAYRVGVATGERFSLAVRHALFEDGLDVADDDVLQRLRVAHDVVTPTAADEAAVHEDLAEGKRRCVEGSPHFFTADGDFFCPSLDIDHDANGYDVSFDADGFHRFALAAFA